MKLHYFKRNWSEDKQHGGILCVPTTPDNHSCSSNPTVDDKLRNISFNPAIVIRSFDTLIMVASPNGLKIFTGTCFFFSFFTGNAAWWCHQGCIEAWEYIYYQKKKACDRFYASQLESELLHKSIWPCCNVGMAFSLRMSASNISLAALVSLYIKGKAFKTFSFPLHT